MKKTEIGDVPEEWEIKTLGDTFHFERGYAYKSNQITEEKGIPLITINNFQKEGGKKETPYLKLKENTITPKDKEKYALTTGDLLIANTDMSKGNIIGAPRLTTKKENGHIYSMDITRLKPKTNINPNYTYHLLKHPKIRRKMKSNAQGTNVQHLNTNLTKNLKIPLPPLPEQEKIAEILSTVDEGIEQVDRLILRVERIKRGMMKDLFSRGVQLFRFYQDRFEEVIRRTIEQEDHTHGERPLTARLLRYLQEAYPEYTVDGEYEKKTRERPDLIIHTRGEDTHNLFAIEVNVWSDHVTLADITHDVEKLERLMLEKYTYAEAVMIVYNVHDEEKAKEIINSSSKVNYIIILRDGRILIRERERRMKKTEIGDVPEEWSVVKLESVIEKYGDGGTPPTKDHSNFGGDITWITIEDITKNITTSKRTLTQKGLKNSNAKIWPPGTIIFSFGATIGKIGIARTPLTTKQGIAGFQPDPNKITSEYLYYTLTKWAPKLKKIAATMGSTIKEIRPNKIINIVKIPLPPLPEQEKIAEILSTLDDLLDELHAKKGRLERVKKGLMNDLLTGRRRVRM